MVEEVRDAVYEVLSEIVAGKPGGARPIRDGLALSQELGLDSMDLALVVATLEAKLGVDPFQERVAIARVRTVGDLVAAYAG